MFMLKSAIVSFYSFMKKKSVFLRSKSWILSTFLVLVSVVLINAQETAQPQATPNPQENKKPAEAEKDKKTDKEEKKPEKPPPFDPKNPTAEQIAETAIVVYGNNVAGREVLKQIRKTAIERGKLSITNADGSVEKVNYEKRVLRGESFEKEKIRYDQESPSTKYALIYNDNKVVGIFNETFFTPRDDASKAFQNQLWHGIDALLRYKENGSTVKLDGREKFMGNEYHILELNDKENRKTRYFISTKTFKVMWLEYTDGGVNYIRRFYDYRLAQNTWVPYRTVLFANKKQIEETQVLTVTYGQKVEEGAFQTS